MEKMEELEEVKKVCLLKWCSVSTLYRMLLLESQQLECTKFTYYIWQVHCSCQIELALFAGWCSELVRLV